MNILIAGARSDGHAKVVLEIIRAQDLYNVIGFIDDDKSKHGSLINDVPVLTGFSSLPELIKKYNIRGGIVAIGHNSQRRQLSQVMSSQGLELINAIHPTAYMDKNVSLGKGCVLCQGSIIITGSVIGDCVNIHTGATIDHDNHIGHGGNLGPGVHTAGRVKIGENTFIGTGASIIPDIEIGEGCIIGAGSVVIRKLPPFSKAVGNPARIIEKLK